MTPDFQTQTFGKWILAGEHSVLRGVPALVFPLKSKFLTLKYFKSEKPLQLILEGSYGKEMELLFWGVLEKSCEICHVDRSELQGTIVIDSNVPVGAGMGASATLCVAIAQFFSYIQQLDSPKIYEFARELENLFHGESSGVDIAVALEGKGLLFRRNGERKLVHLTWEPRLYISYTGKRGVTSECVKKVKDFIAKNPEQGLKLDQQMESVVLNCLDILTSPVIDQESLNLQLIEQLKLGCDNFDQWGLNEGEPRQHMNWLIQHGAIAVKPTGSGGGGYVISLWPKPPPMEILPHLIPCF